jgi:hypothetical protein
MTGGDAILEKGAARLQELSDRAAASGGPAAKLAEPLAEDAVLLRRMKPSLIAARLKGEAPRANRGTRRGPSPLLVIGVALVTGVVLAKVLDWRGHAHPRG